MKITRGGRIAAPRGVCFIAFPPFRGYEGTGNYGGVTKTINRKEGVRQSVITYYDNDDGNGNRNDSNNDNKKNNVNENGNDDDDDDDVDDNNNDLDGDSTWGINSPCARQRI